MQPKQTAIQRRLLSMQDVQYRDFNSKLIPTVDPHLMIGIRTPLLRKFAKELFKTEPEQAAAFMHDLPHRYFEENNLHAFLIENIKDFNAAMDETEKFLPFIDNWATCDSFSPSIFKKYPDAVYQKILTWIQVSHTYTVRYAIGLLLSNYLDERFKPEMLELVSAVKSEEYYINMMIAWYFSFALIKQYDAALPYIKKQTLAPFTHNKTIQKAVESYRIPADVKDYLRTLKV
ncbi:DNA alkylation repair protein [Treponema vincentii]|uniref:DNA alkylation repair protein n=1 Tax=Treponema vincentii TaxID=69710 RepID=UPI0020A2BB5B|nr:DNA alkylation repair protein [Treponema vincentii]UTC49482.1 DNA alkylation repair protein [Treponema vincentii]